MINDKAILVGVDGSHASYKATWWAANYAKHAGLTLQIVCAYSLPSYAAVSFDATYTAMGDDNACWAQRPHRCRHMLTARLWWCRTPMMTVT